MNNVHSRSKENYKEAVDCLWRIALDFHEDNPTRHLSQETASRIAMKTLNKIGETFETFMRDDERIALVISLSKEEYEAKGVLLDTIIKHKLEMARHQLLDFIEFMEKKEKMK